MAICEATWAATADKIREDILSRGVSDRGVLRQHYDTDALDASTLLAPIFGFLPRDDDRASGPGGRGGADRARVCPPLQDRRNRRRPLRQGGTFLICSFWLVSALAIVGEEQRARDLMERLLRIASPLGLYAEEFETETARHLGNFPQAFSHLALIEAAARIIVIERLKDSV